MTHREKELLPILYFRICNCEIEKKHGYFYARTVYGSATFPFTIFTFEFGAAILNNLEDCGIVSTQDLDLINDLYRELSLGPLDHKEEEFVNHFGGLPPACNLFADTIYLLRRGILRTN